MPRSTRRWFRRCIPLVLATSVMIGPVASVSVRAQAPAQPNAAAGEGESDENKGRPLDGYLLMVMLASLAFFVVGKTARR